MNLPEYFDLVSSFTSTDLKNEDLRKMVNKKNLHKAVEKKMLKKFVHIKRENEVKMHFQNYQINEWYKQTKQKLSTHKRD